MRQPWLNDTPSTVPDDFSPRSPVMSARRAALVLAVVFLLLAAGRAGEIASAAYDLPMAPGTEPLIAAAEAWDGAMASIGLPAVLEALKGLLATGR